MASDSADERMFNEYETVLELYSGSFWFESSPKHWLFRVRIANARCTAGQSRFQISEGPTLRQRSSPYIV
jgi:ferric-dicitrate binding protein FerR (iron transport regulator)